MQLFALFTIFSTVLSQSNLRGSEENLAMFNDDKSIDFKFELQDDSSFEWKEFTNFQDRFSKRYASFQEMKERFAIFKENFQTITAHNSNPVNNFTMGVNKFSDMTSDEFRAYVKGVQSAPLGSYGCKSYSSSASSAPSSMDWRQKGGVTSVKDQGQCGSCWTFSAAGSMEGAWAISQGKLIDLSEQQLVDCATGIAYGSHGCNGGQMEGADKYAIEQGMCSLAAYPYVSGNTKTGGECKASTCSKVAHFSSCSDVKPNDQVSLKGAVAMQPVSVAVQADSAVFQHYSSGVLTDSKCGTSLNHGVLAVGYGTENGQKYWLVKNSWGTGWGDAGYIKIGRSESTNDPGVCGIAIQPSFITV